MHHAWTSADYTCELVCSQIDVFGEISGISFTPAGDSLYVGIADITYGSLLSFRRSRHTGAVNVPAAAAAAADVVPAHV